jgi:hypothetical protein
VTFAIAADERVPNERMPAVVAKGTNGGIPAGQLQAPAATVGASAATESWLPSEIGAGMDTKATGVSDPVEWLPAQATAGTSSVDATAPPTALVPEQWLIKHAASPSGADAAAAADIPPATARWIGDAATISAPIAASAAIPVRSDGVQAPLLRFGLPVAVVAVSLIVALAIAGVFSSPGGGRPAATRTGAAGGPAPATASPAAIRPVPATHHAAIARAPQSRRQAARSAPARHAASRSTRAATPAVPRRLVTPVAVPHKPVTVAPPPPHRAPAAPQHTPPQQRSQTRPTHRSGDPGRQPISG